MARRVGIDLIWRNLALAQGDTVLNTPAPLVLMIGYLLFSKRVQRTFARKATA